MDTIWIFGQGKSPGPEPDDVGLLHTVDMDGNHVVALPGDRRWYSPAEMEARCRDERAVLAARNGQIEGAMRLFREEWQDLVDEPPA